MPNGRCSNHGGKSPCGIGHPRYKQGLYSKWCPAGIVRRAQARAERQRVALWRDFWREVERRGKADLSMDAGLAILRAVRARHARRGWFVRP